MSQASTELNETKQIALSYLEHCFAGRVDAAMALLAPDATWWVLGDPDKIKVAGTRDATQIARFLKGVLRGFPEGMQVNFEGLTAEGERVAIEASSSARLSDGTPFRNRYHFLLKLRDGRVHEVREYMDTQHVYEIQQAAAPR